MIEMPMYRILDALGTLPYLVREGLIVRSIEGEWATPERYQIEIRASRISPNARAVLGPHHGDNSYGLGHWLFVAPGPKSTAAHVYIFDYERAV